MKKNLLLLLTICSFTAAFAQNSPGVSRRNVSWMVSPYEDKVFIENRGQFDGMDNLQGSAIYYGVDNMGTKAYFTAKGLTYRFDKIVEPYLEHDKSIDPASEKESKNERLETKSYYLHMEWVGANPNVVVKTEEVVPQYYNFPIGTDPSKSINFVKAYKKLIYKELYKGIDVEYLFPEKGGIKYNLILHPGADLSQVKMKYNGMDKMFTDNNKNIHFALGAAGEVIDHAPISFYDDSKNGIASSFVVNGNEISFQAASYDKSKTVIVDPWTINPAMTTDNKAFDIEHDAVGNVYIFGGLSPYKLKKFTPGGALIWTTNSTNTNQRYGDLAVTGWGTAYITAGHNGCNIVPSITKVNSLGAIQWNNTITSCMEFWAITATCAGKIVVQDSFSPSGGRLSNIDTTNGNRVGSIQITGGSQDFRASCLGPNGNYYMITSVTPQNLVGCTPAFATIFNVNSGHTSPYNATTLYANGPNPIIAGFNGVDASPRYIYHTDGAQIWKRNINNGALITQIAVPGGLKDGNCGVAVDGCGNVFIGSQANVLKYDSNLTLITTTNVGAPVYDVTMGMNGEVLVCGNGFAASLAISSPNCAIPVTMSSTPAACGSANGTATATATGGGSISYSWSNGQTTSTITGLSSGTYTVTVSNNGACGAVVTKTVAVTGGSGSINTTTASTGTQCFGGNNGTASASATTGTSPYTYSWSAGGQTTQTATGLSAGTYTVSITDAGGCSGTITVNVTQPLAVSPSTSTTNASCTAQGSVSTTITGGTGAYTYSWSNGQTGSTATNLTAGNYTLTVTDNNGCSQTATAAITGAPGPTLTGTTPVNVLCNGGNTGSATATATGGTGTLTYVWSNGQSAVNSTGLTAGTYTVVITDGNGCTITSSVIITEPPVLAAQALGTVSCSGQAATASVTGNGGTGAYNYLWNNGQNTQTATGLTNGIYTVTITDANNCTALATAQVNSNSTPSAAFTGVDTAGCAPLCVTFSNTTANITTWAWDFGDGNTGTGASPKHCYTNPGTYSVTLTVTDNNGCTGTYSKNAWIQVHPQVTASFTASPQPTTVLNPVIQFTDLSLNATSWNWSFGDILNSTSTLQNPRFDYKDSGCYTVRLIADNINGCADTSDQVVCIMGDYELFAPNAFTPDGSGLNDIWNVRGIGIDPNHFELWIFDRWGNLIFKTNDLYQGWDGRANGGKDIAQQDVYVWKVAAMDFLGAKHSYIGHVTLVR